MMAPMAQRAPHPTGEREPSPDDRTTPARPLVSIVAAVHDVAPYLPAFIESIERQGGVLGSLEVIAVDDGSTDGSRAILEAWRDRSAFPVTVVHQANAGQAAARNAGLASASGVWVTFCDPDDMLGPGYLDALLRFAGRHPDVALVAGMPVLLEDRTGTELPHARHAQYAAGERVVDLDAEPNVFSGSTAVSLFRLDRIREQGLAFDPRVRPTFEDGHFAARYVLGLEHPAVGIVPAARYIYRRRGDGSSSTQRGYADTRRYTAVLEHGYLDVIARAKARYGRLPAWVQQLLVYELTWYLLEDERISTRIVIEDDVVPRFHELLAAIMRELDPAVVADHRVRRLKPSWRDILVHAGRGEDWHSPAAAVSRVDNAMRLRRVVYRYVGTPPPERVTLDGAALQPAWSKTQAHIYYRRPLLWTRILWLPDDDRVALELAGRPVAIREPRLDGPRRHPDGDRGHESLRAASRFGRLARRGRRLFGRPRSDAIRREAATAPVRARFAGAWVLMDRANEADDNGERLFEHLREHRPDINAWFAISAASDDYDRLRASYGDRIVARGTREFQLLMLNASWLLSSHADGVVTSPPELDGLVDRQPWRYAFLQHGVIKDDLSVWLNKKQADLFVVSTGPELASVVADGTAYAYSGKETRNTGLPRFDRLRRKAVALDPAERDLVLVSPTWRSWLTSTIDPDSFEREIHERFWASEYLRCWDAVLRSPRVAAAVDARGWTLGFMPHPILQPLLPRLDLPAHVRPLTFADEDVQGLYARAALLVTDYSSVAFNVAYVDGAVVYFQFDREAVLRGQHIGRPGYFDYERDGFGPVVTTAEAAIEAIVAQVERGPRPDAAYQARIDATFPQRDGRACERVVETIESMNRPYPWPGAIQAILDKGAAPARGGGG
jgi:glycosyltransferase involved in cell wall biosynthesis